MRDDKMKARIKYDIIQLNATADEKKKFGFDMAYWLVRYFEMEDRPREMIAMEKLALFNLDSEAARLKELMGLPSEIID